MDVFEGACRPLFRRRLMRRGIHFRNKSVYSTNHPERCDCFSGPKLRKMNMNSAGISVADQAPVKSGAGQSGE